VGAARDGGASDGGEWGVEVRDTDVGKARDGGEVITGIGGREMEVSTGHKTKGRGLLERGVIGLCGTPLGGRVWERERARM